MCKEFVHLLCPGCKGHIVLVCLTATSVPRLDGYSTSGYNKILLVDHFLFNLNQGRGAKKLCLFLVRLEVQVQIDSLLKLTTVFFSSAKMVFVISMWSTNTKV